MQDDFIAQVYYTLNGSNLPEWRIPGVENAFAEGKPCMQLYESAYDAYQRLRERLGVIDEDADVEIIFNSLMEITRLLCIEMYKYGVLFSTLSLPSSPSSDK